MRIGPKALVGLGLPAALRPYAPDKGVGANVWRYANNSLVLKAGGGYWLRY